MKKLEENPIYKRQIELLKKKYIVDEEAKTISVTMHYQASDELYLSDCEYTNYREINKDVTNRISDILSRIPLGYQVDLAFKIDDYQGCSPKQLTTSFSDYFEESHYSNYGETKKRTLQIAFLLVAGILLLIGKVAFDNSTYFAETTTKQVISEIIDISAWVFIWESVSIMFLSPSEEKIRSIRFQRKIKSLSFLDQEGKNLYSTSSEEMFSSWIEEGKIHKIEKYALLIGGAGILGVGCSILIRLPSIILSTDYSQSQGTLDIITHIITAIIALVYVISGLCGISAYANKGKLRQYLSIFGIVNSIIVVIETILLIYSFTVEGGFSFRNLISGLFSILFNIFYMIGYFSYLRLNNFHKKKNKGAQNHE